MSKQPSGTHWFKSSHSGSDTNCVEVAKLHEAAAVRDSKDPHGATFLFTAAAWSAFVASVKGAEYPEA
jgi:hypothetical protein